MNWLSHTIVDDEFLFAKDSSIRLWELWIRGNHLPIHMISDSWTTQKEHVQKDVWNISIISIQADRGFAKEECAQFLYLIMHYCILNRKIHYEFPPLRPSAISLFRHSHSAILPFRHSTIPQIHKSIPISRNFCILYLISIKKSTYVHYRWSSE